MTHTHPVVLSLVAFLLGALALTACDSSTGELTPGPRLQIRQTCLRTACGERMASESRACASCRSACFSAGYDCDPSDACDYSCDDIAPCGDWESECVEEGFEVELPNNPSDAIRSECGALDDHLAACGFADAIQPGDCQHFAITERPAVADYYACMATLSCEEFTEESSRCTLEPSTFGDEFCGRMETVCPGGGCGPGDSETLNELGTFLRDDVTDGAIRCAGEDVCQDAVDCFAVWADAVL